ncbi:MAG: flagellar biosynthesis protein FlgA [Rhodospirillaceae bacterium]|nr:flagellar biosynthesis protein FlgA [Rhodospirillaceae bacterium]MBT3911065.1 flagellar biosynthesis protein FlgA [Rhodospirillaceae bacterium]MBT5514913.1 flagellar biosynthesis protein FlgA [Rhodospirillaceae bacterium]MBT6608184.1 flagellar biosynthesis protein FlgA [Rhodospirillaceae bacterium]MBT7248764.1 flagellar biosynthesis protein FlgA [Rhodospirillaceae bacterium]
MNLHRLLQARAEAERPVRVGLIGAGKFGSMFLSQALRTTGMHVLAIADLDVDRAKENLATLHWPRHRYEATSAAKALAEGTTWVTDDADAIINAGGMDVVIEATGDPDVGTRHALAAIERGRHIVMVNVEADVLAGPLLAARAKAANVVYSLAYGDQPALICEMVDWARTSGLDVVAAGKGTLYMPAFHASTPDTIWDHYGLDAARAKESGMNAKMFNSFLDGTKSGIEMAAVANATGLTPAPAGLSFPACAAEDLAGSLIPETDGGVLHHKGQVEVISSRGRDGVDIQNDLRWGVYVTFEAPTDYVERCFADYGLITDASGRYSALWRPYHLIGLELGSSVASAALLGLPTGAPDGFRADVAATAKRDLKAGEELDGEGGYTVWGRLIVAGDSLSLGAVPIGLAHGASLKKPVKEGQVITWNDLNLTDKLTGSVSYGVRREMEAEFSSPARH